MSTTPLPSPAEQLNARIDALQRRANDLQREVLLASVKDELENLHTLVGQLSARVQAVRTAGYVFGKDLEPKVSALKGQWPALRSAAQRQLTEQGPRLEGALRPVEARLADLNR
jgi:predicted  nucleic acid-binding Zn-ribbon protein